MKDVSKNQRIIFFVIKVVSISLKMQFMQFDDVINTINTKYIYIFTIIVQN